jgi:hypothetical protein
MEAATVGGVTLLEWPGQQARRAELRRAQEPCFLVVPDGVAPPLDTDVLEDWARQSADPAEVYARLTVLAERAARRHEAQPVVDGDGLLHWAGQSVVLSPIEARLVRVLAGALGSLVTRDALHTAGWGGPGGGRALELQVVRLRRRLAPVGLAIDNVRGQGYVLKVVAAAASGSLATGV